VVLEAGGSHIGGRLGREPDHHRRHLLGIAAATERDPRDPVGRNGREVLRLTRLQTASSVRSREELSIIEAPRADDRVKQ
jgi:hypothetical protein